MYLESPNLIDGFGKCKITSLIPGFSTPNHSRLFLESDKIISEDSWITRLAISEKIGIGFAAPGGFFTKAVYESVIKNKLSLSLERFKDSIIVELGAGGYRYGYELALLLGAKGYIGVEPFYYDALFYSLISRDSKNNNRTLPIPWSIAPYDMLSFLKGVPDGTVSLFTFGIERCIVSEDKNREEIECEISRVLSPTGGYLSFVSDFEVNDLYSTNFSIFRKNTKEKGRLFLK